MVNISRNVNHAVAYLGLLHESWQSHCHIISPGPIPDVPRCDSTEPSTKIVPFAEAQGSGGCSVWAMWWLSHLLEN